MYLALTLIAFFLGGIFALLLRIELLTPGPTIMDAMTYNRMFTLHGVVMIFLFMIPAIPGVFGNFFLPDHARRARTWPSRASTCSRSTSTCSARSSRSWGMIHGGADTGWTFYTPYSTTTPTTVVPVLLGVFILGLLVDPHRPQLHRHHPHPARARA